MVLIKGIKKNTSHIIHLIKGYSSIETDEAGGCGGDVAFKDKMLHDLVVGKGVDVVVEGSGDFDYNGVVAWVKENVDIVVDAAAIPFHAAVHSVDPKLTDVVDLP